MARAFGWYFRKATDAGAPLGHRVAALRNVVRTYNDLTKLGYHQTWTLVGQTLGLQRGIGWWGEGELSRTPPELTGEQIDAIAQLLLEQRERFLVELRRFEANRRMEKAAGRRQPTRRQVEELYAQAWPSR